MRTTFTREVSDQIWRESSVSGRLTKGRLCASWLMVLLCTMSAFAQSRITGRVVDDQQSALARR
jgi:hypothetical protein